MVTGIAFALLTSLSWAVANVFIQRSGQVMGAPRALLWALIVGLVASLIVSFGLDTRSVPLEARHLWLLSLAGVTGLVGYFGMFLAFEKADLTVAVPVVSSWSLIAAGFSVVVLGERPTPWDYVGALLVCVGVITVGVASTRGQGPFAGEGRKRGLFAVAAASAGSFGFGVMIPLFGQVAPALGPFAASAAIYALCVVLGAPLARALKVSLAKPPPGTWRLILIAGISETVGFVSVAVAQRYAPMTVVAPVSSLAATLTVVYAWVVLRQRQSFASALGTALVCTGVVVLAL